MLDEREIDIEIARLEYMESSYPNYAKLADLYTIRNQMNGSVRNLNTQNYISAYSEKSADDDTIDLYGDSEFFQAIAGRNTAGVLTVIDELMDTLKVVNQKVYKSVIGKIKSI